MKKIAIRKLNRTQLKKDATKEVYITGKILLDFFGYHNINELATSRRDEKAKKRFFKKQDYFFTDNPPSFLLNVTKENNEVRLTGFSEHLPPDVMETDTVVLESFDLASGEIVYLFDVVKNNNALVFSRYEASDDLDCYEIGKNSKGIIQFNLNNSISLKRENAYWAWDDHITQAQFEKIILKPQDAIFAFRGNVTKKRIRIVPANISFKKVLRALSNSNNAIETQAKELYYFEEETIEGWKELVVSESKLLEIACYNDRFVFSDRNQNSFTYFYGG